MNIRKNSGYVLACVLLVVAGQTQAEKINKKSLLITDLDVVNGPVISAIDSPVQYDEKFTKYNNLNSDAVWSFGQLIENMSGDPASTEFNKKCTKVELNDSAGTAASKMRCTDFIVAWLNHFKVDQPINGFTSFKRGTKTDTDGEVKPVLDVFILNPWQEMSRQNGFPDGQLDMSIAPFRLLSIVNRMDLRNIQASTPFDQKSAGEGRFVFSALKSSGEALEFLVILEYELPAKTVNEVRQWAQRWVALNEIPATDTAAYNFALRDITDRFTASNMKPEKPNGSALNQIRTNEIALITHAVPQVTTGQTWELREFNISPVSGLPEQVVVNLTPDIDTFNNTDTLKEILENNQPAIFKERYMVPADMLGASSVNNGSISWMDTLSPVSTLISPEKLKDKFNLHTCNGCHSERNGVIDGFGGAAGAMNTHIKERSKDSESQLSPFLSSNDFFNEIDRRAVNLTRLLQVKSDFNADGKSDRIIGSMTGQSVSIRLQDSINFTANIPLSQIAAVGDLDGDNETEVILFNESTREVSSWNLSTNTSRLISRQVNANAKLVGVADLNNDTKAEIVWFDGTTVTAWQFDNLSGSIQNHEIGTNPHIPDSSGFPRASIEALADMNANGKSDILWKVDAAETVSVIQIWEVDESFNKSNMHEMKSLSLASGWKFIDVADFDADGRGDVVWFNSVTDDVLIWEIGDFKVLRANKISVPTSLGLSVHPVATGDYNGDGITDILLRDFEGGAFIKWFMRSDLSVINPAEVDSVVSLLARTAPFYDEVAP